MFNVETPPTKHVLLRHIREAVCHRLRVLILRMPFEPKVMMLRKR